MNEKINNKFWSGIVLKILITILVLLFSAVLVIPSRNAKQISNIITQNNDSWKEVKKEQGKTIERVVKLEADTGHINEDIGEIKEDINKIDGKVGEIQRDMVTQKDLDNLKEFISNNNK